MRRVDPGRCRILVVGEALIDIVRDHEQQRRIPGGSPATVALGLGRLGEHVELLTCIAPDDDGMAIVHRLIDSGVRVLPHSFSARRTPTALVLVDEDGKADYRFDVEWSLPSVNELQVPDALHIGSYSAFLRPGAKRVAELVTRTFEAGRLITFDPNIRPKLMGERSKVVSHFEDIVALASVVKLSDDDAGWLYPGKSTGRVLSHLLELGPKLASVTLGAAGSVVATRKCQLRVAAKSVSPVDSIGAGDSYMASLIQSVLQVDVSAIGSRELRGIGTRSSAAAAFTVGRPGAELPWAGEIGNA